MPRRHGSLVDDEELDEAAWVAVRGAGVGAAKWGLFSIAAGALAYRFSPIYRGLTFQFKVYVQMSGMAIGSMIEADKRLRAHERIVRVHKQLQRDAAVWQSYFAEAAREEAAEEATKAEEEASRIMENRGKTE